MQAVVLTSSRRSSTSNNFRVSKTAKHFAEAVRALFALGLFAFYGAKKFYAHRAKWRAKGKAGKSVEKKAETATEKKPRRNGIKTEKAKK